MTTSRCNSGILSKFNGSESGALAIRPCSNRKVNQDESGFESWHFLFYDSLNDTTVVSACTSRASPRIIMKKFFKEFSLFMMALIIILGLMGGVIYFFSYLFHYDVRTDGKDDYGRDCLPGYYQTFTQPGCDQ